MNLELFGYSTLGTWDFLGTFTDEYQALLALDDYAGMGYKNIKYCNWKKH